MKPPAAAHLALRRASAACGVLSLALLALGPAPGPPPGMLAAPPQEPDKPQEHDTRSLPRASGCLACHEGIEEMHPKAPLTCVDCHGGNAEGRTKLEAHVQPLAPQATDERVAPLDVDLAWRRFRNPMDLRVAELTCGGCHKDIVRHLATSLHGTTAGHLSDGFYEMGLLKEKGSVFSVFPVPAHRAEPGDIEQLVQVPAFRDNGPRDQLGTHYSDLARKECMQCHLWSPGRAVRGRVGFDGDYRGEGCAACHVPYALDGLSRSGDRSAVRTDPGRPREHSITRAPTTHACTACHYGDASIGLHFRGLSQLPPGAPGGPEIPGSTDALLNRVFYLDDPAIAPPDVHHERGMHCIDCHTARDVMGDGILWGAMEKAVEISCQDCHGSFTERAPLRTQRGTPLTHVERRGNEGELVVLKGKVDGVERVVPEALDVLDPVRPEFNPHASEAMTAAHARLECYTCHAGWNTNFLGFHFDRNESLTQLDLLSGKRTPGRVTTQEKLFTTWKSFFAGFNPDGRIAPYLTGFATMGTVRDAEGKVLLDQVLPETAAGLSGLTMIHHQLHSTRPTARSCVECHRSPATWGLGSLNFQLGRHLAFVADRRGIEVVALDRAALAQSLPLAKLALPDVVDMVLECDSLQGRARTLYASEGQRGLHVIDVRDPTAPQRLAFTATVQPRGMALAGERLYLADGIGGLRIFDVSTPGKIRQLGQLPTFDAHDVFVQWPHVYVADGAGGLCIVDVRRPEQPRLVGGTRLSPAEGQTDAAISVRVLFQYSRPVARDDAPVDRRTRAHNLCVVLDAEQGPVLIDATEPTDPVRLWPPEERAGRTRGGRAPSSYRGMALASHIDLAELQGGARTREADVLYVLSERTLGNGQGISNVQVLDVSQGSSVRGRGNVEAGESTEMLALARFYNPPFLQSVLFSPGDQGVFLTDVTISAEPRQLGALAALRNAYAVAVESFPLDKMLDESGRPLKDVSHAGARWLELAEIERILDVPAQVLGTERAGGERTEIPGATARLYLQSQDKDRSGFLEGTEVASAGNGLDRDSDGRVTLAELAYQARLKQATATEGDPESAFLRTRVDTEGDLARLFDGVDPSAFDGDKDKRLSRQELARALHASLDLDRDGALTLDELSRHPGELRSLRFGDAAARALFAQVDDNKDRKVQKGELRVRDAEWLALDIDSSGFVELGNPNTRDQEQRGIVGQASEWPVRQRDISGLSPLPVFERVMAVFDADGNQVLTQRELRRRPDLFLELDADGDTLVDAREVQARVGLVATRGVEGTRDGFLERWDLDGDGKVAENELSAAAWIAFQRARPR